MSIWARGDVLIEQLQRLGNDLHTKVHSAKPNPARIASRSRVKWMLSEVSLPRLKTGFPMH